MNKAMQQAVDIACQKFYGSDVTLYIGSSVHSYMSKDTIRRAVKYITLDNDSRKIWDDPKMTPAQKYQNIPQVDISTYSGDYIESPVIQLLEDDSIRIHVVYSASRNEETIVLLNDSEIRHRFCTMGSINKLANNLSINDYRIEVTPMLTILGESDITSLIVHETPEYGITIKELYERFKMNPEACYVPYRRGWSRLLNMREITTGGTMFSIHKMEEDYPCFAHIHEDGCITCWDGVSTRRESHGVKVEAMNNYNIATFYNAGSKETIMRLLDGTHEHMENVSIVKKAVFPGYKFYAVWSVKGINVGGFEFAMS